MIDVWDILLLQLRLDALADANQAVLVAARNSEELQLRDGLRRIGDQLLGRKGVRCGRKDADPRERVEVSQPVVQRLPATHLVAGLVRQAWWVRQQFGNPSTGSKKSGGR